MSKSNGAVVGESLFNKNMAIESAHFLDGENTYTAEAAGLDRQNLTLCDVTAKLTFAVALKAVECNLGGSNITLQSSSGEIGFTAGGLKQSVLNKLVFNGSVLAHFAGRSIAAMEAHKCICQLVIKFTLDFAVIHGGGHRIVNVKQCYGITCNTGTDLFGKSTVNINLTAYGDTL